MGVPRQVKLLLVLAAVIASVGVAASATGAAAQSGVAPLDSRSCFNGTFVTAPESNAGLAADCVELVAVRNRIMSDPQNARLEYNDPWWGAGFESGRVISIDLSGNQFSGSVPAQLSNLNSLRVLNLSGNQFSGPIPVRLGNLSNLQKLDLSENQLSGSVPAQLANLQRLRSLRLSGNQFSGTVPAQLGNLNNLVWLDLAGNQLSGAIPAQLGNLNNLVSLDLAGNQLSGAIPAQLGDLRNLEWLDLAGNQLSGAIPAQLGNLNNLQWLYLSGNQLSGAIPAQLGNLNNLQWLYLSGNQLSGAIPEQLGNLSLNSLWIQNNRLSGEIPAALKVSVSFKFCDNRLTGALPEHLHTAAGGFSGNIDDIASCYEGRFKDAGGVHQTNIEQIAEWRITLGCKKDRFCPSKTVTRHQMAAFLYRAVTHLYGTPEAAGRARISDVDADAWYRPYARWAVAAKVMRTVDAKFNPSAAVTRADMAEMLVAAFDHLSALTDPQDLFSDLTGIPVATIRAIEGIHSAGVTQGCSTEPLKYCPNQEITRAQMASFLTRAIRHAGN